MRNMSRTLRIKEYKESLTRESCQIRTTIATTVRLPYQKDSSNKEQLTTAIIPENGFVHLAWHRKELRSPGKQF